jgi:hypothetical protein
MQKSDRIRRKCIGTTISRKNDKRYNTQDVIVNGGMKEEAPW